MSFRLYILLLIGSMSLAVACVLLGDYASEFNLGFSGAVTSVAIGAIGGAVICSLVLGLSMYWSKCMARSTAAVIRASFEQSEIESNRVVDAETKSAIHSGLEEIRHLRSTLRDRDIALRLASARHDRIESVLRSLDLAVIVTTCFDEVELINTEAARMLNIDENAIIGCPIASVIPHEDISNAVIESRKQSEGIGIRRFDVDGRIEGREVPLEVSIARLDTDDDETRLVTLLRDMTRERELSQMKSDFVSKASHELRTPLSSIRGYIEMLVDGEAEDDISRCECYRVIQNETERLSRLIDNMLNISRIESGMAVVDRKEFNMVKLVEDSVVTLSPEAREKEISISHRFADVDLHVDGDSDMVHEVILNLISNAIKYTPKGGRIVVVVDTDNLTGSVVVKINDTGLGIPPDALPHVFDKFYRVENLKRFAKGTGLGLNLCRNIVETLHQGQIGVDSTVGMGSSFWFSLPMQFAGSTAA